MVGSGPFDAGAGDSGAEAIGDRSIAINMWKHMNYIIWRWRDRKWVFSSRLISFDNNWRPSSPLSMSTPDLYHSDCGPSHRPHLMAHVLGKLAKMYLSVIVLFVRWNKNTMMPHTFITVVLVLAPTPAPSITIPMSRLIYRQKKYS